ncbi:hypothetical protein SDC9_81123 [bioreactor metagenome]|uniref:Gliding motility-associated protein GldM N-terminal domain-containing protein n=1 Tax=bioreactor metagenome TaxID=1076179 RepID=A0A644Z1N9_9ZZZZ
MFNMFNMLLALNISKEVYKDFVQPAITYNAGTDSFAKYNSSLVEIALADSTADTTLLKKINTVHTSAGELVSFIRQVKISLISLLDDIPENDAAVLSKDYYNLQNKFNFDIPTYYLCGTDKEGENGKGYEIQMKIEAYRNLLQGFVANDKSEAEFVGNLLSTSPLASSIDGQNVSWVMYYFYHIPDLGVLNTLTGLEYKIVLAENSVISHLAKHRTGVANQ